MILTVVLPVRNGFRSLPRSLGGLSASTRQPDEVIVVDDRSSDGTADLARRLGARVIVLPEGRCGPAAARNHGACAARGDLLMFVDADVVVHPDALARIENRLIQHPEVDALFGSYDDDPPESGVASRYKNLLHHYTYQASRREAATFWAGCGAIRRDVFLACGGFDEERYRSSSIEDIELGSRLVRAGRRVWSCNDVQAVHLKRWSFCRLIYTDIVLRAVPWSRLIARSGEMPDDLNLNWRGRLSALAAWFAVVALASAFWVPSALAGVPAAVAVLWACNAGLLRLFARRGGVRFAVAAAGLHFLYHLYSSLTFVMVAGPHLLAAGWRSPLLPGSAATRGAAPPLTLPGARSSS